MYIFRRKIRIEIELDMLQHITPLVQEQNILNSLLGINTDSKFHR